MNDCPDACQVRLDHLEKFQLEQTGPKDGINAQLWQEIDALKENRAQLRGGMSFGAWVFGAIIVILGLIFSWRQENHHDELLKILTTQNQAVAGQVARGQK